MPRHGHECSVKWFSRIDQLSWKVIVDGSPVYLFQRSVRNLIMLKQWGALCKIDILKTLLMGESVGRRVKL